MRATYPQSLIRREITRASAIFLIVAGAALAVTPIPLGAFMVAFGFAMLIPGAPIPAARSARRASATAGSTRR